MIKPKKWHIYTVDLEPRMGTKPRKQRPCLCIQPSEFCEYGLGSAVVLPLTTNIISEEAFPLRVRVSKGTCSLEKDSDLLIEQMLAWDIKNFKEDLGVLPEGLQLLVSAAVRDFLDL